MQGSETHFLGYDPNGFQIGGSNNQLNISPWTENNPSDKYPRFGYVNSLNYNYWNPRTFLKLKDLSLSYTFDKSLFGENQRPGHTALPGGNRPVHHYQLVGA